MPLVGFVCPDGEKILCKDCLVKCRFKDGERCMPYPQLKIISRTRDWTGKISVTQALNGTRYNYLAITKDYFVNPKSKLFTLIGTNSHSLMEENKEEGSLCEARFEDEISYGTLDYFTPKTGELIDYKFPGSFTVKKTLGLSCVDTFSETECYTRDTVRNKGKVNEMLHKKGTPKVVKRWYVDPTKKDDFEYQVQCNKYRIFLERKGYTVNKMTVCLTPRDFNTRTASTYGLSEPPYLHNIEKIDDYIIDTFYKSALDSLLLSLNKKEIPSPCTEREAWGGRRCEKYCDVREFCTDCPHTKPIIEDEE